jgi:Flp pilus assembly protein TadG
MTLNARKGQAILLLTTAVGIVLTGAIGFAVDVSTLYFQRQMAQAAADAAAVSAAMSMFQGTTTGPAGFSTSATFTCGTNIAMIPCKYANYHGFGGALTSDTITVSFPTSATGYSGSLSGTDSPNQVKVTVARQVSNNFIRLVGGPATTTVGASAIAAIVTVTSPVPMLITHPSDSGVLQGDKNTSITICGGPSRSIQINSSSPTALTTNKFPTVDLSHAGTADSGNCTTGTGADMGVFGGPSATPGGLRLGTTGQYLQPASPIQDPFATLAAPTAPANPGTSKTIANGVHGCTNAGGCTELTPGLWADGMSMGGHNYYVLDPGLYYIQGGGFKMKNVDSAVMCSGCAADPDTGNGMLIYDTGSKGNPTASGGFNIDTGVSNTYLIGAGLTLAGTTTPSAPYYGMLFWEDRSADAQNHGFGTGNGCFSLIGTIYITNTLAIMQADATHYQSISYNGTPCSGTVHQGEIITGELSLVGNTGVSMNLFPTSFVKIRQVALVQ